MPDTPLHTRPHARIHTRPRDYPTDAEFKNEFGSFFVPSELMDKRTGLLIIDALTMELLVSLRRACDFPFIINSGTRSESTNEEVGGHPTSAHMAGRAFDIKVKDGAQALDIASFAYSIGGFQGIGVRRPSGSGGYVHLDDVERSGGEPVLWTYL